ncbi:carbohydrate ABC transporter permease [Paenibacillus alginolyticus]|uniref:Carbohydrate ABC transporter permease n=1 Tax=Paenibacillus alginolyticus TaxID=59839 RepID=A0ABT4GK85_9BACL|nr:MULTISPECIES: carbohydrate ABC transporter permease [Paenibacillus]MCY9670189.1 carbohydrate ABC transporter permease [Paenibacillus alginolyticus]MCY9696617.1 carbohydrate ABC transporter permease [Paenibacillus alginolyticus]MEC0145228.1 carbohydrate ABC transporter permease [Paenibacillus alginolyticus]NRF91937.1 carbohydrate ABC transporter permease [Paenibacillus frigoriresistens]
MKTKKFVWNRLLDILTYLLLIISIFPIAWMVLTSLKTSWDAQALPPVWAFVPTLENYISLFTNKSSSNPFGSLLWNSTIVSLVSTVLSVVFGALAAYSLSRFRLKKGKDIAIWILSTRMFPPAATLVPVFMMMSWFNLIDTYAALIIPYTAFNLSFVVWMLKGFFDDIPVDLEEAATVDGCSRMSAFTRIILPLVAPGLAATAIICLMFSWNEFMFALVLSRNDAVTAPVIANQFVTMYGVKWGELTAASTLMTAPVLFFAILVRNHMIKGLTMGSVK